MFIHSFFKMFTWCIELFSAVVISIVFSALVVVTANAQNIDSDVLWVSEKTQAKSIEIDVRDLPVVVRWQPGDPIKDMPRRRLDSAFLPPGIPKNPIFDPTDPLLAKQALIQLSEQLIQNTQRQAIGLNFDGAGYSGVNPPDPTGDVGKNYYIQMINDAGGSVFSIYNKSSGTLVAGPTNLDSLGSGNCANGLGDPIVLYDELAGRWFLSEFSNAGNRLCIYVSKTDNPITGGWHNYDFQAPSFPDYPKYGVWSDAYYVGSNEGGATVSVYALDRNSMLAGNPATAVRLASAPKLNGFGFQMITPVDHEGDAAPPTSTPGYFLRHRDDEVHNAGSNDSSRDFLELWQFSVNFSNTSQSRFTKVADIPVAEFSSDLCGLTSFYCFAQPGSTTTLDPLREPVMNRPQYRNFGNYETIVGNYVVDVNGSDRGGIRWFELRRSGAGSWQLHQEGTYAPGAANRWMGSAAMDKNGNIAIAYSYGSSSIYPSLRQTGRLASDPLGTMTQTEAELVAGTSNNSSNRWGDYSHLAVDPVDDCTFWYTNEYGKSNGQWGTRISNFTFNDCGTTGGNVPPTASFTSSCNDLVCSFDASASTDSDGSITDYRWNFGDGATGSGVTASHTYTTAGQYTVTLTVTDNENATGSTTRTVNPTSPGGPKVFTNADNFSIPDNNATGVSSPINVTYSGNSGTVSVDVDIKHTYIGDLVVDLIHPNGTEYNLHNRTGGSANDILKTYSVNVGAVPANGQWQLRVRDLASFDEGIIDLWSITFP